MDIAVDKVSSVHPHLISQFSDKLVERMGLYFAKENWHQWEGKLKPVARAFGFGNVNDCLGWLTTTEWNQREIEILARYLTIGETYFFRDSNAFKILEKVVLPQLIQEKKSSKVLRIWSTACCTGEEPYSLAILLHRMIPNISEWNISILGTDINKDFLNKSQSGIYKEWSFRTTPKEIKNNYFIHDKQGNYKIIPEIKKLVNFIYLNLVEDNYPMLLNGTQAMDLILCNNVLIYFTNDVINKVIHKLVNAMVWNAWLITSAVEVPYILDKRLQSKKYDQAIFFRKKAEMHLKDENHSLTTPLINREMLVPLMEDERRPLEDLVEPPYILDKPAAALDDIQENSISELYSHGLYQDLIDKLEPYLSKNPHLLFDESKGKNYIIFLAKSYANLGFLNKALEWIGKALNLDKLDPEIYLFKAAVYQEQEHYEEAATSIKKAIFLEPHLIIAYYVYGHLMIKIGHIHEAAKSFEKALRLLQKEDAGSILKGGEGMSAGRMMEIIITMQQNLV